MNIKKIALAFFFVDFAALTAYAVVTEPPVAFLEAITVNWWGTQFAVDLCVSLVFGGVWLWRDAKARGRNPLPWVLALPFTGSLALLVYLLLRPTEPVRASAALHAAA